MGRENIFSALGRRLLNWENGLERRLKEHFTVLVARQNENPVVIQAPKGSYYADPFLVSRDGKLFLFVEQFHYCDCIGRIAVLSLDKNLKAGNPRTILDPGCHASFPFVFEHEGKTYLLPETSNGKTVDLYTCESFPERWTLARRILCDVDAADSILIRRDGFWWLFTAIRDEDGGRSLAIFSTQDLLTGNWRAHPINKERRYAGLANSSGRNAGGIFERNGVLYRVAQDNPDYYGQDIRFLRIDRLSEAEFIETEVPAPAGLPQMAASFSPHHLSLKDDKAAWDIRDRTGWFTQTRIGKAKPAQ